MQIEAFPSWSVVEKRNHKYEFAEKIEPSCSIIYIENPSFNKEQSQKYAIEILQDLSKTNFNIHPRMECQPLLDKYKIFLV